MNYYLHDTPLSQSTATEWKQYWTNVFLTYCGKTKPFQAWNAGLQLAKQISRDYIFHE